ncbi:MAG: hypothetical protein AAGJ28_18775 [Pseudomonadota bacterium]
MKSKLFTALMASAVYSLGAYATAHAQSAGTDSFGYTITGSAVDPMVQRNLFLDISGTAPVLANGDDVSSNAITLGFDFPFYGGTNSQLFFTTNGVITDNGLSAGDLTNDPVLPTLPSTGSGVRIYPFHDDLVTTVHGSFLSGANNPLGTDAFVAQWTGFFFGNSDAVRFNAYLLPDGRVVIAYDHDGSDRSSGASATVGIQNAAADDGVAYFANTAAVAQGDTVLILPPGFTIAQGIGALIAPPPPTTGISGDLEVAALEVGIIVTGQKATEILKQAHTSLASGVNRRAALQAAAEAGYPLKATAHKTQQSTGHVWAAITGGQVDGNVGSDLDIEQFGVQIGADVFAWDGGVLGLGLGFANADTTIGGSSLNSQGFSITPYGAMQVENWVVSGMLDYTFTRYTDYNTPTVQDLKTDGHRFSAAIAAEGTYSLGDGVEVAPILTLSGGTESLDDLNRASGGAITTGTVSFVSASAAGKISIPVELMDTPGRLHALGGVEYIKTFGNDQLAQFATSYPDQRIGGLLGAGMSFQAEGVQISLDANANGIGSEITGVEGRLEIRADF